MEKLEQLKIDIPEIRTSDIKPEKDKKEVKNLFFDKKDVKYIHGEKDILANVKIGEFVIAVYTEWIHETKKENRLNIGIVKDWNYKAVNKNNLIIKGKHLINYFFEVRKLEKGLII